MDAFHILLGRPWQYDRGTIHDGVKNTYSFFIKDGEKKKKLVLKPMKNDEDKGCSIALVNRGDFIGKIKETGLLYVLFQEEEKLQLDIPSNIREILDEYRDVMLNELPDGLPLIRDIQHHIDLMLGAISKAGYITS